MSEYPISADLNTKIERETVLPQDFLGKPAVLGYALDSAKAHPELDQCDAEQLYDAYQISDTEAILSVHITNLSFALERIPELRSMAEERLISTYDNHGLVTSMLPEAFMNAISFREGQKRPAVSFTAVINLEKGTIQDRIVYLTNATNVKDTPFPDTEPQFERAYSEVLDDDSLESVLWKIAWKTNCRRYGEELANQKLLKHVNSGESNTPFSKYVIAAISNITGEVFAEYTVDHTIPQGYWNKVETTIDPATSWPMESNRNLPDTDDRNSTEGFWDVLYPISLPQRNADYIVKGQPFIDTLVYKHDELKTPFYIHGTAPVRQVDALINIDNIARYLTDRPYYFDETRILSIARRYSEERQRVIDQKIQQKSLIQKEKARLEKIAGLTADLTNDLSNLMLWKEMIPYISGFKSELLDRLRSLVNAQITSLEDQPYQNDEDRHNKLVQLMGMLEQSMGLQHECIDDQNRQIYIAWTLEDRKEVINIEATDSKPKRAKKKVLQLAGLTLFLRALNEFPQTQAAD